MVEERMSIVKAKAVDVRKLNICSPRRIIDGENYTYTLTYAGSTGVMIQFPRCQLLTGLYESDGKCYCDVLLPSHGVTTELYADISQRIETLIRRDERFLDALFVGHMKHTTDGSSCLRLKMPQNKSRVLTEVVSKDNNPLSFSRFTKGCTIIPIVSIEHVYVIDSKIGFSVLLNQAVVVD